MFSSFPVVLNRALWLSLALGLVGCNTATPTPVINPVASQVALRLTQTASVPSATAPPATPTATATATLAASLTPTESPTPTITPTPSATGSPTPAPRSTEALSSLPRPPQTMAGAAHFFFGPPAGGFIASTYRYGSVGPSQRFAPHHGVDYSTAAGENLTAVAAGTIYYAGNDVDKVFGPQPDFYGNVVVIQLTQIWEGHVVYALYGHLDQVLVQTGQVVNAGEVVGTVGATGVALGAHPHLEVRLDSPESYWDTRNPELWLAPAPGTGTLVVRLTNADNWYLPGTRISLLCSDGAQRYMDTYWYSGVNPDNFYGENAAMMNLPAGRCHLEAQVGDELVESEGVVVKAGEITLVWLKASP